MNDRILIVDDDPQVTEQVSALLDSFGYDSLFLLEPEYLMPMLEKKEIDLLLLDIHMPGIDGLTLLKQLKSSSSYQTIPVIMLTGDTNERLMTECFNAGAMDFVNKPVSEVELKARIKSALSIKNHLQEVEATNRLLKKTFDGMAEGVITLDRRYHIRLISGKACRILDIDEQKAIGRPAVNVLGSLIAGPEGEIVLSAKSHEPRYDIPTEILSSSGNRIPVNFSVLPLETNRKNSGWLLLFRDLRKEEKLLREKVSSIYFGRMVSCDVKMNEIFKLIDKTATSSSVILIKGESGTGKELAAREIHDRSRYAQGPFHAVNCAAISPNLMESEFFGHEQGAFTGANKRKKGRFELADKGTLFLDEVGDIPLDLQGKLLRVLQEHEFERVGGTHKIQVQVRVIAATNKDLKKMVDERLFRDDLYYRLHVIPIQLPPLRERIHDIPLLVSAFIKQLNEREEREVATISSSALQQLMIYSWPGNIRELYNIIEYAFAVSDGNLLQKEHLPDIVNDSLPLTNTAAEAPKNEKELLLQVLRQVSFSRTKAAALLGMHRTTLYRKIRKFNIQ